MRVMVPDTCGIPAVVRTVMVGVCLGVVGSAVAERFFQRRDQLDQDRYQPVPVNRNVVRNENDAAFMLSKYGYLRCRIQRRRRDVEGRGPGLQEHHPADHEANSDHHQQPSDHQPWAGSFLLSEEGSTRVCNDSEVQQAILRYQSTYNLAPTGVLDPETKRLMSTARCGNADTREGAIVDHMDMERSSPASSFNPNQPPANSSSSRSNVLDPMQMPSASLVSSSSSSSSISSSSSSSSSSSASRQESPVPENGVREAQRLWKRATNKIRADDPSHLLRVLKRAAKAENSAQSRHLRHLQNYIAKLSRHRDPSPRLLKPWSQEEHQRAKRSIQVTAAGTHENLENVAALEVSEHRPGMADGSDPGMMFSTDLLRWRLLSSGYSNRIPVEDQRATMDLAFRMWSEVIPLRFVEDTDSHINDVHIEIAFGAGSHQDCQHDFDGSGGEIAHSQYFGNMHFDDDENFKSIRAYTPDGIYLLRVAVHEIGHVLGLAHTNRSQSIMYAIYHGVNHSPEFELSREDRQMVQNIYGKCKGSFSTLFDWVRKRPDNEFIYNTYFFRGNHYWMYENHANRTRFGDPHNIARAWEGVPNDVDGYLHVWYFDGANIVDQTFFFQGVHYYKYNSANDTVYEGWPRLIAQDFGPKAGQSVGIPSNLDSAFFDRRDKNIYFFKEDTVYVYDPKAPEESRGCCERIRPILEEFPSAADTNRSLETPLDAVYYSYTEHMQYFFRGEDFWRNRVFDPRQRRAVNQVEYMGKWYDKWNDICDVQPH